MDFKKYITKKKPSQYVLYTLIILLGIVLDQWTKALATEHLAGVSTVPVIEGFAHLTYHINRGIAFGMLQGAGWLFNTVTLIVLPILALYVYLAPVGNTLKEIAITMIISGGIGNTIDRLSLGYVVDFIDFSRIGFNAIFNVADSFVTVGAFMLIGMLVLELIKETKNVTNSSQNKTDGEEGI